MEWKLPLDLILHSLQFLYHDLCLYSYQRQVFWSYWIYIMRYLGSTVYLHTHMHTHNTSSPRSRQFAQEDGRVWACTYIWVASFPGLHAQLLSLAVRKAGKGLDGFITWCMPRLMSCSVCSCLGLFSPFTLLSLNSVRSFCSVCPASLIATGSIVASYSMWHRSRGTHHMINPSRPSPAFRNASDKSWAWRPGNKATFELQLMLMLAWPIRFIDWKCLHGIGFSQELFVPPTTRYSNCSATLC